MPSGHTRDRPDAGIHRQEDRGAGDQDDNAGPARGASLDSRLDRIGECRSSGVGRAG